MENLLLNDVNFHEFVGQITQLSADKIKNLQIYTSISSNCVLVSHSEIKYPLHLSHRYSIFFSHEKNKKMEKMEKSEENNFLFTSRNICLLCLFSFEELFFVFPSFFFFLKHHPREEFFFSSFYHISFLLPFIHKFHMYIHRLNKTNEENMMEMKRRCLFDIPFLVIDFFSVSVLCRLSKSIFNFLFFSFFCSSSRFKYRHSTLSNALMLFYVCYIAI